MRYTLPQQHSVLLNSLQYLLPLSGFSNKCHFILAADRPTCARCAENLRDFADVSDFDHRSKNEGMLAEQNALLLT